MERKQMLWLLMFLFITEVCLLLSDPLDTNVSVFSPSEARWWCRKTRNLGRRLAKWKTLFATILIHDYDFPCALGLRWLTKTQRKREKQLKGNTKPWKCASPITLLSNISLCSFWIPSTSPSVAGWIMLLPPSSCLLETQDVILTRDRAFAPGIS